MKPTRRGFMGSIAALIAAPGVLISEAKPLIKESKKEKDWDPCAVDLIDPDGKSIHMPAKYNMTAPEIDGMTTRQDLTIDCGEILCDFGPVVAFRMYGIRGLPEGWEKELEHQHWIPAKSGVVINQTIEHSYS